MAGDWIKMRVDLPDDPAVIGIAEQTGCDEDAVIGKLFRLWCWANRQTIDGYATSVTVSWLDRYVGVTGFGNAMVAVGWLSTNDGGIAFPEFDRHNSETAKQRALTSRRMRKKRDASSVTFSEQKRTKRREEKSIEVPNGTSMSSSSDDEPDRAALLVWNAAIDAVISHYQSYHPRARPGAKERKKIRDRLKERHSVEDLCKAIDGCHRSPHHCGQNERGTKYQSLELIMRDASHIQQFLEVPSDPPRRQDNIGGRLR
jgi:hypothetical protein